MSGRCVFILLLSNDYLCGLHTFRVEPAAEDASGADPTDADQFTIGSIGRGVLVEASRKRITLEDEKSKKVHICQKRRIGSALLPQKHIVGIIISKWLAVVV